MVSAARAPLVAGAPAGVAGLATFLVVHHFWILPIWFILPAGLPIAIAGGVTFGLAFRALRDRLPRAPWHAPALAGLLALALLPAQALSVSRGQLPFELLIELPASEVARSFAELVATAAPAGALLGGIVGRSVKAALATALAAALFAIGIGHNVPLIAAPALVAKMWIIILASSLAAALAFTATLTRLEPPRFEPLHQKD